MKLHLPTLTRRMSVVGGTVAALLAVSGTAWADGGSCPKPTGTMTRYGVEDCGIVTCSFYFDRTTTHRLAAAVRNLPTEEGSVACGLIPIAPARMICMSGAAGGNYAIRRIREADAGNGCFRVRYLARKKVAVVGYYNDGGRNCMD